MGILSTTFWMLVEIVLVVLLVATFLSAGFFAGLGSVGGILWFIALIIEFVLMLAIALQLQHGRL